MKPIQLEISLHDADLDDDFLDQFARGLRNDLLDLGVENVTNRKAGAPPKGSKSFESVLIGGLLVKTLPDILPKVIDLLQAWVVRQDSRTVIIKAPNGIEVEFTPKKNLTPEEIVLLSRKLSAPDILTP